MSRSFIITLLVLFPSLALVSALYFVNLLKRFMEETPRIETGADMDAYRAVVKKQMYAALAQIVILGIPIVLFIIGTVTRTLRMGDLMYTIVPNAVVIMVSRFLRGVERKMHRLPASDLELERERDHVVAVWEKKALPDW